MRIRIYITRKTILTAYKFALRTGKLFRLNPCERAILTISAKIVDNVKSQTLREILLKIFDKISSKLTLKIKAFIIGLELVKKRIEQALMLGYENAKSWLKDVNYILYLGFSYLSAPPIYRL